MNINKVVIRDFTITDLSSISQKQVNCSPVLSSTTIMACTSSNGPRRVYCTHKVIFFELLARSRDRMQFCCCCCNKTTAKDSLEKGWPWPKKLQLRYTFRWFVKKLILQMIILALVAFSLGKVFGFDYQWDFVIRTIAVGRFVHGKKCCERRFSC